ncbi:MAG: hypothetical protein KDA58_10175 [Planctomycetaceae bacterium]|nr:hypothetical protein [Planctomycetaceae bacterium]
MRTHTCNECEFVYIGDDLPETGCPECGVPWPPILKTPDPNAKLPLSPLVADASSSPAAAKQSSDGMIAACMAFVFGAVVAGSIVYWSSPYWFPIEATEEYQSLTRQLDGMTSAEARARERLQATADQLVGIQSRLDTLTSRAAAQNAESETHREYMRQTRQALLALRQISGNSFIRDWQLLGPLAIPEQGVVTDAAIRPLDLTQMLAGKLDDVTWATYQSGEDKIDLAKVFSHREAGSAFGVCWVESPIDHEVVLSLGSDDGIAVWMNGELIHQNLTDRSSSPDQDRVAAHLRAGWNELLVRVDNNGTGDWNFFCEFRDAREKNPLRVFSTFMPPMPNE